MSAIKEIRELTGLSHEKLGQWLGVSKSMVQFAEFSFRTLQGEASDKLLMLSLALHQLKTSGQTSVPAAPVCSNPAEFAARHKAKYDMHAYQAQRLQRQLQQIAKQQQQLITGLALAAALKNPDSKLYSSTATDIQIAGFTEYFNQDKLQRLAAKAAALQDKMELQLAYAEVHRKQCEVYAGMDTAAAAGAG